MMQSAGVSHILVVEDTADYRRVVVRILETAGFTVTGVPDFARAIEVVEGAQPIAVLLADIGMPPGTPHGISIATAARRVRPDLSVVYMTGGEDPAQFLLFHDDAPVLRKPFTSAQLIAAITAALAPDA
jgi:CheY-like chemotaxis protein